MYKRLLFISFILLQQAHLALGSSFDFVLGEKSFNQDTVSKRTLDSIVVSTSYKNGTSSNGIFAVGSNIIHVDSSLLLSSKSNSLADYIREKSSIYLKEYGRGMRAYISIRGTSSSHTSLTWNGVSLAVPTLGQTDLSHIPIYFFDNMKLHVGGASSLYGDGSIGGAIQLNTLPKWKRGLHGDVTLSAGSFSTYFAGTSLRYSTGKFESRSAFFHSMAKNNYYFNNATKPGLPREKLNNSSYANFGVMQEFYKKIGNSSLVTFNVWYLDFNRDIQPSMSLNDRPNTYAFIIDKNLRSSLSLSGAKNSYSYSTTISYSNDYERYKEDIIAASKVAFNAEGEYGRKKMIVKGGVNGEYTIPSVESYTFAVKESRAYGYLLLRYDPIPKLFISAGIRGGIVTDSKVPFMPSFDIKYRAVANNGYLLTLRSSISKSSKIPSLNDRYWGGAHTYLKSEISSTAEMGADYSFYRDRFSFALFTTFYRSNVKNWIRWFPAGQVWRPQNIPKVNSKGCELGISFESSLDNWNYNSTLYYNYINVKTVETLWGEDPTKGHQLAYQPFHNLRLINEIKRAPFTASLHLSYTGERTTLDIYDKLKPYLLVDMALSYLFTVGRRGVTLSATVKNLTNRSYQNVKFYPMAPINYNLSLRYDF